ncbi:enoyl-CoA hydratase-related protein [Bradyrhizobium sp. URHD0069]|uniref:enoyl-CoA hydratase-related protein n=1 Tax=Bradyrhizobium sp. URHD0069 TaxID=1380355 RepID=UPI0009DD6F24|nr:enoyl-CoA hydratase-related protein [Bradyrhizobium sp. URHD0069]
MSDSTPPNADSLVVALSAQGVADVTLNRPLVRNAYDEHLVGLLHDAFRDLSKTPGVRAIVLQGAGTHFCAGADITWMRRAATFREDENLADAKRIAAMFQQLHSLPLPTIALVQGACLGGGVGLVAACDVVIAGRDAQFGLTEVRIGLTPSVISPYVVAAMGPRQAQRYLLTGERFSAARAHGIGLVHELVDDETGLRQARDQVVAAVLASCPSAVAATKALTARASWSHIDDAVSHKTAAHSAAMRVAADGREGMQAFLERRRPSWFATEHQGAAFGDERSPGMNTSSERERK